MNIFLQMSQGWDYSLIIAQTALAISVLTAWHDGFFYFIKKQPLLVLTFRTEIREEFILKIYTP